MAAFRFCTTAYHLCRADAPRSLQTSCRRTKPQQRRLPSQRPRLRSRRRARSSQRARCPKQRRRRRKRKRQRHSITPPLMRPKRRRKTQGAGIERQPCWSAAIMNVKSFLKTRCSSVQCECFWQRSHSAYLAHIHKVAHVRARAQQTQHCEGASPSASMACKPVRQEHLRGDGQGHSARAQKQAPTKARLLRATGRVRRL